MSDHPDLWKAAADGDVATIETILDATDLDDLHVGSLDMAIEVAVRHGHVTAAELLLETREDVPTQLHPHLVLSVALHGPVALAERVFDLAGDVSRIRLGRRTPLHSAAQGDHADIIGILLHRGTNVDLHREHERETPLHVAARYGNPAAARRLLYGGADPNAANREGMTPLTLADMHGHDEICALLLTRGADPTTRSRHQRTPLHRAAESGGVKDVRAALEAGGSPNARDFWDNTPLHLAVGRIRPAIVRALVDAGADVNLQNNVGDTPLLATVSPATVRVLLEQAADVNLKGAYGWSALHALARMGDADLVGMAIDAGADLELRNDRGETPFLTAAYYLQAECLEALANAGADVGARDSTGRRAAELVVEGTDEDVTDREIVATVRALARLRASG